jgi:hypothetical protein
MFKALEQNILKCSYSVSWRPIQLVKVAYVDLI